MRIKIMGRMWDLLFQRTDEMRSRKLLGLCDPPETKGRKIWVSPSLKGEERLEVIIHELTHAAGWHIDEPFVEQFGIDLARTLWRLGYRNVSE